MPVSLLTDEQERRYGRYYGEPSPEQLERYFHLDDADRDLIGRRRGDYMRLGFAVQLGTVRFLGTFIDDPTEAPPGAVEVLATQLDITSTDPLVRYAASERRRDHTLEILERYGYRLFAEPYRNGGCFAGSTRCAGRAPIVRVPCSTGRRLGW